MLALGGEPVSAGERVILERAMKKAAFVLAAVPALVGALGTARADFVISAYAHGSTTPGLVAGTQDLVNGDFLIHANAAAPTTGDGTDEATTWAFDFAQDGNYGAFTGTGSPITSAVLTITLTQFYAEGPVTDLVRPMDLFPNINMPHFLQAGETGSISFELLDYYSASDVEGFMTSRAGLFPMIYADDAIVSSASLVITKVPSPGTIGLMGLGGLLIVRRRR